MNDPLPHSKQPDPFYNNKAWYKIFLKYEKIYRKKKYKNTKTE